MERNLSADCGHSAHYIVAAVSLLLAGCGPTLGKSAAPTIKYFPTDRPHPLATWPPKSRAIVSQLCRGVKQWNVQSADGTELTLLQFHLSENPRLQFGLIDQDGVDANSFDNRTDYYPQSVVKMLSVIRSKSKGRVVAAWNGLFFAYDRTPGSPPHGWAHHIGPNVIDGMPHFNVGRHRWFFGIKDGRFKVALSAELKSMDKQFDFGADGAQYLVRRGSPTRLQPFPKNGDPPVERSLTGKDDAGHIPGVDHMRTSRTSIAWNRDSTVMWLAFVRESDTETNSKLAAKYGRNDPSGWTLFDLQRFWLQVGVYGAINSDGGSVAQLAVRESPSRYKAKFADSLSPRELMFDPDHPPDRAGGALMYFYVIEKD